MSTIFVDFINKNSLLNINLYTRLKFFYILSFVPLFIPYTELGNTLNTITTQIGDKTGQIALITQQLVIFAGKLNEALKKQSANQTQEG